MRARPSKVLSAHKAAILYAVLAVTTVGLAMWTILTGDTSLGVAWLLVGALSFVLAVTYLVQWRRQVGR